MKLDESTDVEELEQRRDLKELIEEDKRIALRLKKRIARGELTTSEAEINKIHEERHKSVEQRKAEKELKRKKLEFQLWELNNKSPYFYDLAYSEILKQHQVDVHLLKEELRQLEETRPEAVKQATKCGGHHVGKIERAVTLKRAA